MPAYHHINPKQMRLFATAHELMNIGAGDAIDDYSETESSENPPTLASSPDITNQKLNESRTGLETEAETKANMSPTLYNSIKQHGVLIPVMVQMDEKDNMWLLNGHHRVAAANDINPDMFIPLHYSENMWHGPDWEETGAPVTPEMKAKNIRRNRS